jgi:hypothetical protein
MPISYSEYVDITCASCGTSFEADAWTLIDAAERSDLAQALRDGTLNLAVCPKCSAETAAGAALLLHDPAARRVYFAVPPDVGEHIWRERAQELMYMLVASLPEDQRRPYLGDVQVEQELDGVRRALLRNDRRRGGRGQGPGDRVQATEDNGESTPAAPTPNPQLPPPGSGSLIEAVRALLAADNDAEFTAIVAATPALLGDDADAVVRELADLAYADGERDVATALRELRVVLARLRSGADGPTTSDQRLTTDDQPLANALTAPPAVLSPQSSVLTDSAYQALLHVDAPDALLTATRDYPALLEAWADADLAARIEVALEEGNERLAGEIEVRREDLLELRAQLGARDALVQAIQALLAADGEDAVADTLSTYPILLTDIAQEALSSLADDALARGDQGPATQAIACQTLLRTVRAGLEEQEEQYYD